MLCVVWPILFEWIKMGETNQWVILNRLHKVAYNQNIFLCYDLRNEIWHNIMAMMYRV